MGTLQRFAGLGRAFLSVANSGPPPSQLTSLSSVGKSTLLDISLPSLHEWTALSWQRMVSLIPSLEDMQLLAAPKKKVTPHRKGNRSAGKNIRFIPIVAKCSSCDRVFPPHAMPAKCEHEECPAFNLRERPGRGAGKIEEVSSE